MEGATGSSTNQPIRESLMKTSILISAVLAALGIAASASAATRSESAVFTAQAQTEARALTLAKHGADDGLDGADDNGVDFIIG